MSLGDSWGLVSGSPSKLNKMTVVSGTGSYLASLDKDQHKIFVCTSSGSGFTEDHVYLCTEDGLSVIDITNINSHTHYDDSDGGPFVRILSANNGVMDLVLTKTQDLDKANWIQTTTSTGTIENKTDGTTGERSIRLRPNGTSGSGASISYPHLKLDFSEPSNFSTKLQIETASNLALHSGVNCDFVTDSDSNTVKYNAEVCTTTNLNWWLRTANGSSTSRSDSGLAISTSRVAISLSHRPDEGTPHVDLYLDTNSAFQKTTNIPTSGASSSDNVIKHSIKNSTGSDRPLLVYGTRLSYVVSDNWPV